MADEFKDECNFCGSEVKSRRYDAPISHRAYNVESIYLCKLCAMIPEGQFEKSAFLRPLMFAFNEVLKALDKREQEGKKKELGLLFVGKEKKDA